jgi:hypothetical protein
MDEILPTAIAAGLSTALVLVVASRYRDDEAWWLVGSWFAHLVAIGAQFYLLFNVYRGDAMSYSQRAIMLGEFVGWDRVEMLRVAFALIFQQDGALPFALHGTGAPTGSMTGVALFLLLFTGPALYAPVIVLTLGACLGKIAMYQAFRDAFPRRQQFVLLLATCYVPTVVFWSSSMLKEAVVMVALGPYVLALQRVIGRQFQYFALLAVSALFIGLLKPYILLALVVSTGAWLYANRAISKAGEFQIRPVRLALVTALAVAGLVAIAQRFPEFSGDELMDSIAQEQANFGGRGGSAIEVLDPTQMGPLGQLVVAPVALFNAWFRPSLLDAHNTQELLNALETSLLLAATGWAFWLRSPRAILRDIAASPLLMFSLAFAFTLGLGVGLTTANLGTLSRYRMPLVPFLAALLALLSAPQPVGVPAVRRAAPGVLA